MTTSTPTRLRLVAAPPLDPPFDDDLEPRAAVVTGTLALAFPPATRSSVPLRLLPPALPPADPHAPLPDPRVWSQRLVQAVVEVLAGSRAAAQLSAHATLRVLDQLEAMSGALAHARASRTPARRPVLRCVRTCRPHSTAVEVSAVVDTGERSRAIALRLDGRDGRWRCTALEIG